MAFTIGSFGVGTLAPLAKLIACFYAACLLFIFVVLGAIARWHGFGIWAFIKYISEEIFIVFGTSSSESVLPRIMEKLEALASTERWLASSFRQATRSISMAPRSTSPSRPSSSRRRPIRRSACRAN